MAAASVRDIRRRIASVRNTQQITKAMEMVAAAKLRRAQARVIAARPFATRLEATLSRLVAGLREAGAGEGWTAGHPLLAERPVRQVLCAAVTADRGLAGGYNANVIRRVERFLQEVGVPAGLVTVGRKARDYFRRRRSIEAEFVHLGDDIDYTTAREVARALSEPFASGRYDAVYLVYSEFVSAVTQRPTVVQLLPIRPPEGAGGARGREYLYVPSPGEILGILVPRYVEVLVYRALLEAKASEHGARMTAMRNASDNAEEMIESLTLSFNKARQAGITKEIAEIVGGAEALVQGR